MALEAASGPISLPEKHLADMLADCPSARAFLNVSDAPSALARVHFDSLPPPAAGGEHMLEEWRHYRPFVIVCTNPREGWTYQVAALTVAVESGSLILEFERDVPAGNAKRLHENFRRFKNELGGIAKELAERARQAGYLDITRITLLTLWQSDPELHSGLGDFLYALLKVDWGVRG